MLSRYPSPLLLFSIIMILLILAVALGPAEKSLGTSVRLVYLHGAWVWTSLLGFVAAALVGMTGLIRRHDGLHRWSRAIGRTALLFWITFIPMSMAAAQFNWNGLFLVEPRWRMAFGLAVSGVLLQAGVSIMPQLHWNSLGNMGYSAAAFFLVGGVENVMHPEAAIRDSESGAIQAYFLALLVLTLLAAWQVARGWLLFDQSKTPAQPAA